VEESPKSREIRIKEALEDNYREGKERSRYFARLEKSNRKQKAIFADHYKNFIIPSAIKINEKLEHDHKRMLEAQKRMHQLEIEQDNNEYTLKKSYGEYLK